MSVTTKKVVKIFFAIILLGVIVFFSEARIINGVRSNVVYVLRLFMNVGRSFSDTWGYKSTGPESILSILAESPEFKASLFEVEKLKNENMVLRRALKIKEETGLQLRGANVFMRGKEFGKEFLLVDQGRSVGVSKGNLVIDPNRFLVGKVAEVEEDFAKVAIASNADDVYEVTLFPLKVKSLARGIGARAFSLELVPEDVPVRQGDFLILTEQEKVQFALGEVVTERPSGNSIFNEVRAVLLSRPENLREVFIILK